MAAGGLSSPLFGAVEPWLAPLGSGFPSLDRLNALVEPGTVTGGGRPLRFVPASPGVKGAYELRVFQTGEVETRERNWHDLFNALAWLAFPRAKAAINRGHHEELARGGHTAGTRGTARDVLSLFDEGGVIVASADAGLTQLLRDFRWKALFWERRDAVAERMRFYVFGHAILEKALEPYKGVTAKALLLDVPATFPGLGLREQLSAVDGRTAEWLGRADALGSTRALSPLPVLGVPGWSDGQDAAFYDDAEVFRPGYR